MNKTGRTLQRLLVAYNRYGKDVVYFVNLRFNAQESVLLGDLLLNWLQKVIFPRKSSI